MLFVVLPLCQLTRKVTRNRWKLPHSVACNYKCNLLTLPKKCQAHHQLVGGFFISVFTEKMCQTLMVQRQKSSCSLSGRFWQSLYHSFHWEVKMTAAESQWAISLLDIIYHQAFICTLNQTLTLMLKILTKKHVNTKLRGSPYFYLSLDTSLPLLQHDYWNWHSRRLTVMRCVRKCVFLCVSAERYFQY